MTKTRGRKARPGYQFAMLVLSLYALGVLAAQSVLRFSPGTQVILDYADYCVCAIFFADFLISLGRAENRWRYLRTWGWLDLLSSIPAIDLVRWGRVGRILRVFLVLRGLRATKLVAGLVVEHRAENAFLAASLVALLLVVFCSVAILQFETTPESNIRTPEEALWWAFVTITTVGYGDRYPVTGEGRVVAAILMVAGVGLFGTLSGFLAAWFVGPGGSGSAGGEVAAIREELKSLKQAVLTLDHRQRDSPAPPAGNDDP